jgi:pimeloyl-ACP methyl ester carboxylesterase
MKRSSIIWWLIAVWWLSGCSDSSSNAPLKASTESGEVTVMSAGVERTYYLIIPDDYDPRFFEEPLLFAYHGTTGTYDLWLNGFYDLLEAVGDDAIVVLTQALPDINGVTRWNYDYDFEYFEDVLADVESRVNFDPRRVFVTGHSNGAGMAHELGCNYGDLIRGIAALRPTRASCAAHNVSARWRCCRPMEKTTRWSRGALARADISSGFSTTGLNTRFQNRLHQEGSGVQAHDWPSFASASTWQFFASLDNARPTADPPAGGGNARVGNSIDTTLSFTLRYPPGIVEPTQGAVSIYAAGTQQPVTGGPNSILNLSFDPGDAGPGSEIEYVVPIRYVTETFPGTYAFSVVMYVAAGGNPIPLPGHDHIVFHDVDVVDRNTPVFIDAVLVLEEVFY